MKFYIAFSIHGTNKYKVAEFYTRNRLLKMENFPAFVKRCLGEDFIEISSRRKNYNIDEDGIKVSWIKLMTKAGKPMKSPAWVARRFKELESMGWKIVKDKHQR